MRKLLGILCVVFCLTGCAELKEIYLYNTLSPQEWNERQRNQSLLSEFKVTCDIYGADKAVNTSLSYTQFLTDLAAQLKDEGNEIVGNAEQNMVLHRLAYTALDRRIRHLNEMLSYYQSLQQETHYQNLQKQREAMSSMRETIGKKAQDYEKHLFVNKTGMQLASKWDTVVSVSNPQKGVLYSLSGAEVFQNTKGGVLVRGGNGKIRFVATNNIYVDDEYLNGLANYTGITSYITTLKSNKTIYAFKELPANKYKSVYDKLLFYSGNENSCAPYREATYAEIRQAFKSPSTSFVEKWGVEEIDNNNTHSKAYHDASESAVARQQFLSSYSSVDRANSVRLEKQKGVLENINTLFMQKE